MMFFDLNFNLKFPAEVGLKLNLLKFLEDLGRNYSLIFIYFKKICSEIVTNN